MLRKPVDQNPITTFNWISSSILNYFFTLPGSSFKFQGNYPKILLFSSPHNPILFFLSLSNILAFLFTQETQALDKLPSITSALQIALGIPSVTYFRKRCHSSHLKLLLLSLPSSSFPPTSWLCSTNYSPTHGLKIHCCFSISSCSFFLCSTFIHP